MSIECSATGGTPKSPQLQDSEVIAKQRGWKKEAPRSRKTGPSSGQGRKTTPDLAAAVVACSRPVQDQASELFNMEVEGHGPF